MPPPENRRADEQPTIGIGSTGVLSLRVSVASLARVVCANPEDGEVMLALERKATFIPRREITTVKTQPFGGALRIHDLLPLWERIGEFHFDSQRAQAELDFRLYIRPSAWETLRDFCLEQLHSPDSTVFESSPERELVEEFSDALGTSLHPDQYRYRPLWTLVENEPVPSENLHAERGQTVRVYRVFEVQITDPVLVESMLSNSRQYTDTDLLELARRNFPKRGVGRSNAMRVLPMETLISFYLDLGEKERNLPVAFDGTVLEPNVTTLLDGVLAARYQRV